MPLSLCTISVLMYIVPFVLQTLTVSVLCVFLNYSPQKQLKGHPHIIEFIAAAGVPPSQGGAEFMILTELVTGSDKFFIRWKYIILLVIAVINFSCVVFPMSVN